jgi:hypothetical protein
LKALAGKNIKSKKDSPRERAKDTGMSYFDCLADSSGMAISVE